MTQHANGSGAVPVPPIDPGNLFCLQRHEPHDVDVAVREVVEQPLPCQQAVAAAVKPARKRAARKLSTVKP